jgi:hypothetical protein
MTTNTPTPAIPVVISPTAVGTTIHVDPRALRPFHRNPRRGDVGAIMASLIVNGQYKPVVVNIGTRTGRFGEVLAGSHTLAAFRTLAEHDPADPRWHALAAHVLDVDDDLANRIVLVDNRSFDLGEGADPAAVLALVHDIGSAIGTGYTTDELDALAAALSGHRPAEHGAGEDPGRPGDDTTTPAPNPTPDSVNSYTLVFDNESQRAVWTEFVEWLEIIYPDPNSTPVQRLSAFLSEMPPERRI